MRIFFNVVTKYQIHALIYSDLYLHVDNTTSQSINAKHKNLTPT